MTNHTIQDKANVWGMLYIHDILLRPPKGPTPSVMLLSVLLGQEKQCRNLKQTWPYATMFNLDRLVDESSYLHNYDVKYISLVVPEILTNS